jgi:hypothetical protein
VSKSEIALFLNVIKRDCNYVLINPIILTRTRHFRQAYRSTRDNIDIIKRYTFYTKRFSVMVNRACVTKCRETLCLLCVICSVIIQQYKFVKGNEACNITRKIIWKKCVYSDVE